MPAPSARRPVRPSWRTVRPAPSGRYGLLLLILISTYLLSAFSSSKLVVDLQVLLFVAVLMLALRNSPLPRRWRLLVAVIALTGSAVAFGISVAGNAGLGVAEIWKGLLLLVTAVLIVRRVLARPVVTIQSIYGALSAYIIVGLMFAAFYAAMWHVGGSFFANGEPANTQTFQYFSFTTLTTLGYGDFTAVADSGRAVAVMEALTGQVFLATLVARLVAAFRAPAERAAAPMTRRRWPPSTVRRGGGMSYRPKPAGSADRDSAGRREDAGRRSP
jgi:hypothetical protein